MTLTQSQISFTGSPSMANYSAFALKGFSDKSWYVTCLISYSGVAILLVYLLTCNSNASLPRFHEKDECFQISDEVEGVSITWLSLDSSISLWENAGCPLFDPCKKNSEESHYVMPMSNQWITPCVLFDEEYGLLKIPKSSSMKLFDTKSDMSLADMQDMFCFQPTIITTIEFKRGVKESATI